MNNPFQSDGGLLPTKWALHFRWKAANVCSLIWFSINCCISYARNCDRRKIIHYFNSSLGNIKDFVCDFTILIAAECRFFNALLSESAFTLFSNSVTNSSCVPMHPLINDRRSLLLSCNFRKKNAQDSASATSLFALSPEIGLFNVSSILSSIDRILSSESWALNKLEDFDWISSQRLCPNQLNDQPEICLEYHSPR